MGNTLGFDFMLSDNLHWLIRWYDIQCDGDWEHVFGIKIETMDNPGWGIQISIDETELQNKKFQDISVERSETNWLFCKVYDGLFEANCGTFNLPEVLQIFRDWAEN